MANWLESMQQTFEYYVVDPITWKDSKKIDNVISSSINRDLDVETLGSATINVNTSMEECYIRIYLITIQNGVKEKHPLGTFLVQTPSTVHNGKVKSVSMDAYTPLIELKEKLTPIGYSKLQNENIMDSAYMLARENMRAPVIKAVSTTKLFYDFVANADDTWLSFLSDLIANAKYSFALDEMGRVLFSPQQDIASLQPVWTYNDDNSSILYADITINHDMYGIPNVVEVVYSNGGGKLYAKAINNDPNSPISTVNRGREIVHRVTDPDLLGAPTSAQIKEYAEQLLRNMSSLEYTVSYSHGYCPVQIGQCVRLNYKRADLKNVKAKVVSQSIDCSTGCKVTEKAIFTKKLWG